MKLRNELSAHIIEFVVVMGVFFVLWIGVSIPVSIWLLTVTASYAPDLIVTFGWALILGLLIKWFLGK